MTTASQLAATLDPNKVSPGLLGFIIVVLIGLVTWFLARSMVKQLRKLDADRGAEEAMMEDDETTGGDAASGSTAPKSAASKSAVPMSAASKGEVAKNTASNGAASKSTNNAAPNGVR
jgi:hypothetical protein